MPCRKRRPRTPGKSRGEEGALDEEAISILKALASFNGPVGCARIAEKAGLPTRKVTGKLRGLLNKGLVERPEKGGYRITEEGRKAMS